MVEVLGLGDQLNVRELNLICLTIQFSKLETFVHRNREVKVGT